MVSAVFVDRFPGVSFTGNAREDLWRQDDNHETDHPDVKRENVSSERPAARRYVRQVRIAENAYPSRIGGQPVPNLPSRPRRLAELAVSNCAYSPTPSEPAKVSGRRLRASCTERYFPQGCKQRRAACRSMGIPCRPLRLWWCVVMITYSVRWLLHRDIRDFGSVRYRLDAATRLQNRADCAAEYESINDVSRRHLARQPPRPRM